MIIAFDKSIFGSTDFKGVNFLLQLCTYKNRYKVFVELSADIQHSVVFKGLAYDDQELLNQIFNAQIQQQTPVTGNDVVSPNYIICLNPAADNELNLEEAIRFLIQPLSIILENSLNDSYFVKAIFTHFDSSNKFSSHLRNGWIQFENAGGCDNIRNFLDSKMQSFNSFPKNNKLYLRCFVLMDSDKLYSAADLSNTKKKTKTFLDSHSVPYKILSKRSMENYLPIEVYQEITDTTFDNWKTCFNNLTELQKDFLNIEVGFSKKDGQGNPKKSRTNVNTETNNLYSNLSQQDYDTLSLGLKQMGDFKTIFPRYFESTRVSDETLLTREGGTIEDNEFLTIINKIYTLL